MPEKLTAIIITKNEESRLERCLQGVRWADEVIVVDDFSEDRTVEIAGQYGCKVIQHLQTSFGGQRNIGIRKASNEWILHLDADDIVSEELRREIVSKALQSGSPFDAFAVTRRMYFLGKPMLHGDWHLRNKQIRFARREKGWFTETVHERLVVEGRVGELKEPIDHYSIPSISNYIEKMNRYSDEEVLQLSDRESAYSLLTGCVMRPLKRFIGNYVVRAGFLDGTRGFILSAMEAMYQFAIFAKKWEIQQNKSYFSFTRKKND